MSEIIYRESTGHPRTIKYTCMLVPCKYIELYKYDTGNLVSMRKFQVGDLATAGFPASYSSLSREEKRKIEPYVNLTENTRRLTDIEVSNVYRGCIESLSSEYVTLRYTVIPLEKKRKMHWSEFAWLNADFTLLSDNWRIELNV